MKESKKHWYFVTCNHQSWTDITAIQYALNNKIPLLKFFLKKELIWMPLLGVAWWGLDFPFMHHAVCLHVSIHCERCMTLLHVITHDFLARLHHELTWSS